MKYNEFADTEADMGALSPLKVFFRRSSNAEGRGNLTALPLLWVRLVGYGYACARFTAEHGDVGIRPQPFPAAELIAAAEDDPVRKAATGIAARFDAVLNDASDLDQRPGGPPP